MIDANTLWLLSFYRSSEISGALFFGRIARTLSASPIAHDLSRHFADESQHAWLWTDCIQQLGARPMQIDSAYQDRYLAAAGLPASLMEVLALTQVFEQRVVRQYAMHSRASSLAPAIRDTLARIMQDEKWHIRWVRRALADLAHQHGEDAVAAARRRFTDADAAVFSQTMNEHSERVRELYNLSGRQA